ncbi:MAG: ATP-binding cassette domain-containing protein [Nitrospiraceae bacterium]|nr:ATP-binding cassette domain-containing protein [Nitrospiraceae bacterium]
MLKLKDITVQFGGLIAVSAFSMVVREGEIHSLIGPNGAGKTTAMNCVSGFQKFNGEIYFGEEELSSLPPHRRAGIGITRTFQNLELFNSMTVRENLLLGMHSIEKKNFLSDIFVPGEVRIPEDVLKVSDLLGITQLLDTYVFFLPYGIKKIVEIGRALTSSPKLIMLDEPAAGLTFKEKENLKKIVKKIRENGTTILLIEHDMSLVMDISDIVTVMSFGKKIAEGTPEEVSKNKLVIDVYLGKSKDAAA